MQVEGKHYHTVWLDGKNVKMINQPMLPFRFEIVKMKTHYETAGAISTMVVRGAGAIGATAGYGVAQAALNAPKEGFRESVEAAAEHIKNTRPTAQDLFHFVDAVSKAALGEEDVEEGRRKAVETATAMAMDQAKMGEMIGEHGEKLLENGTKILTHCNAGWLAFVDWGSALAPVYKASRNGKKIFVWVDETRPRLQGARLTAWELANEQIPHSIIVDNAAGYYMQNGEVDLCIVGADRVASNGDIANKIGTYEKAVVAKENGIPFYVAVPLSTIDLSIKSGREIPIEERDEEEILYARGESEKEQNLIERLRIANWKSHAKNPAFDVTPAKYITGIITPKGIIKPNKEEIAGLF
ncbi:MAG: S-methyl-5-thioribose-1-phosphate isomerase [Candidatus Diapherotrites archaeon]